MLPISQLTLSLLHVLAALDAVLAEMGGLGFINKEISGNLAWEETIRAWLEWSLVNETVAYSQPTTEWIVPLVFF